MGRSHCGWEGAGSIARPLTGPAGRTGPPTEEGGSTTPLPVSRWLKKAPYRFFLELFFAPDFLAVLFFRVDFLADFLAVLFFRVDFFAGMVHLLSADLKTPCA